jgi:hypothetical protein
MKKTTVLFTLMLLLGSAAQMHIAGYLCGN